MSPRLEPPALANFYAQRWSSLHKGKNLHFLFPDWLFNSLPCHGLGHSEIARATRFPPPGPSGFSIIKGLVITTTRFSRAALRAAQYSRKEKSKRKKSPTPNGNSGSSLMMVVPLTPNRSSGNHQQHGHCLRAVIRLNTKNQKRKRACKHEKDRRRLC